MYVYLFYRISYATLSLEQVDVMTSSYSLMFTSAYSWTGDGLQHNLGRCSNCKSPEQCTFTKPPPVSVSGLQKGFSHLFAETRANEEVSLLVD